MTDTGCPHPDDAQLSLGRCRTVEQASSGSRSTFVEVERETVWCRLCGSLCQDDAWTAPRSLVLPGWSCTECGVFNGAAKELRTDCRSCGAPLDMETP